MTPACTVEEVAAFLAPEHPVTLADHFRKMAQEAGAIALTLAKRFGRGLVIVEKVEDGAPRRCLLIELKYSQKYRRDTAVIRNFEVTQWWTEWTRVHYQRTFIDKPGVPSLTLPHQAAVNAEDGRGIPGGPFMWWEMCTKADLARYEKVFGAITKEKHAKRVRRTLDKVAAAASEAAKPTKKHPARLPSMRPTRVWRAKDRNRKYT